MKTALAVVAAGLSASWVGAANLFFDDFNRTDLNPTPATPLWVGKDNTAAGTNGLIVDDPLVTHFRVLNFTATNAGGDAFTASGVAFYVTAGVQYTLSWDYLGTPVTNVTLNDNGNGGFIGLSDGIGSGNEYWIGGTQFSSLGGGLDISVTKVLLADNGIWHSYSTQFTPTTSKTLYVKVEDFSGVGGGIPGDAYFDNISVDSASVPTPAASVGGLALIGALAFARSRSRLCTL